MTNPDALVRVDVVGEGNYQDALSKLAGPKTEDGVYLRITASLTPEPANPYDENAVAVMMGEHKVGYLARPMAKAFHKMMADFGKPGQGIKDVDAEIRGGWS